MRLRTLVRKWNWQNSSTVQTSMRNELKVKPMEDNILVRYRFLVQGTTVYCMIYIRKQNTLIL